MNEAETLLAQTPPKNLEAERAFVGSVLRFPKYLDEISPAISVDTLTDTKLRLVYATVLELQTDDMPIDSVTVAERLLEKKQLKNVGAPFILSLWNEFPTGALAVEYANIVRENFKRQRFIGVLTDSLRRTYEHEDVADIMAEVEHRVDELEASHSPDVLFSGAVVASDTYTRLLEMRKSGQKTVGIPTGFTDVDTATGGAVGGELFIVGGRPSQGKTSFALNIAEYISRIRPVLFVSVEMSRDELGQKLLSSISGINSIYLRNAKLSDGDLDRLQTARAKIGTSKLWIADLPNATVSEIGSISRTLKRKQPELSLIVVDYLQLLRHETRGMPRHEQVSDMTRRLKLLARQTNCCVMALSQLNRDNEKRNGKRPELSDLRESGSIEQDADVVALMHRPEFYGDKERIGEADCILAKVRNGPIGDIKLVFDKSTTTFRNMASETTYSGGDLGQLGDDDL